jgi:hypothetical protein
MALDEDPISQLPEPYANALRWRREGLDDNAIAARLEIALEALGPLMLLAEAKLRHVIRPAEPHA